MLTSTNNVTDDVLKNVYSAGRYDRVLMDMARRLKEANKLTDDELLKNVYSAGRYDRVLMDMARRLEEANNKYEAAAPLINLLSINGIDNIAELENHFSNQPST